MPSPLENPFRPPIPTVVDYEKEAHAIGLLLGPKAEAAYRKRHAHDLSDPSASVSSGLTAEEQAQMNEKPESQLARERIRIAWGKFFADAELKNADELLGSMEIHDDGSVSLTLTGETGNMLLTHYTKTPPIFPTKIRELTSSLDLSRLESAKHLVLPSTINGNLYLNSLESAKHLVLPSTINGDVYLSGLKSAEHLVLSSTINGHLSLYGLKSAEHLVLPSTLTGNIDLGGLKSAEHLVLSSTIKGDLFLYDLESAKHLVLPAHVDGEIYLNKLFPVDLAAVKAARPDLVSQIRTSF
ncbi:MAG: hypothetical protein KBC02_02295 [Candidatus Pacebacteria bacterium]|nr:hypothetical protein [Candidatus Paceibacterota bacterium]